MTKEENKAVFLEYGFVKLEDSMADDMSVVNSARVSFAKNEKSIKTLMDRKGLSEADIGLIKFLMRERHGTPFEHNSFRFHVKCPLFVAREWFRHRIGSFNEFSARYSEVPGEFYCPSIENVRTQIGKPGNYSFSQIEKRDATEAIRIIQRMSKAAYMDYRNMINMGVAKELSRSVLPVSMYTQFYWTVNARSLMNFCSLRSAENAQYEIRQYSFDVEKFFQEKMPVTYSAWVDNNRICP